MDRREKAGMPRQVNYSLDLLLRDEQDRSHIRSQLALIKAEYAIRDCSVMELGCGFGANLELFKQDNAVSGIEGLASAVVEAQSRNLRVVQGDLESKLEIESGTIDWVLCLDVLEHLEHPFDLMVEIRRILRDSGRAILNVPNHFSASGRVRLLFGSGLDVHGFFPEAHEWDNPHLRFFTQSGIKQLVVSSGFELLDDRSNRFIAFPMHTLFERVGLGFIPRVFARANPNLFASGFFFIIQKALG
jgi:SAM-dependent methyltransferase